MKQKYLLAASFVASALLASPLVAQDQVIRMKTAKSVGEKMTLVVNRTAEGVTVDWGDGTPQAYERGSEAVCTIEGTVRGADIVLTGSDRLNTLVCEDNQLTTLDVTQAASLQSLYCQNNQLQEIDLSKSAKLMDLDVSGNHISNISISATRQPLLENVNLADNGMETLDGSSIFVLRNDAPQHINISGNHFQNIFVTNNTKLDALLLAGNQVARLDVSRTPQLSTLVCNDNRLVVISTNSTTGLPLLQQIMCDNNQLTTLNLAQSSVLQDISCANNRLTELTYPSRKLQSMSCGGNALTFRALPRAANQPAAGLFSYTPQADVDISAKLRKSSTYDGYYIAQCPDYSSRTETEYILDLSDYRLDGSGSAKVTLTPYAYSAGTRTELVQAKATDREQDYTYSSGKFAFLKAYPAVVIEMAHPDYPDLVINSNPFAVGEEMIPVGIGSVQEAASSNRAVYDLQGRRVQKPQSGLFIINGKKVLVK